MPKPEGLVVPNLCSLDDNGRIIEENVIANLDYVFPNPVFVNGAIGRHESIGQENRKRMMEIAARHHKAPVLMGVGSHFLYETYYLISHAESLGAAGLVIRPAIIKDFGKEDLPRLVQNTMKRSSLPIYFYHNSKNYPVLTPDSVLELAEYPKVAGIKITDTLEKTVKFLDKVRRGKFFFIGNPYTFLELDARYKPCVAGAVLGPANAQPVEWARLVKAYQSLADGNLLSCEACMDDVAKVKSFIDPIPNGHILEAVEHYMKQKVYKR
jgi:dihydrodipicolinate synthase/N-acetylneuraminate lyase